MQFYSLFATQIILEQSKFSMNFLKHLHTSKLRYVTSKIVQNSSLLGTILEARINRFSKSQESRKAAVLRAIDPPCNGSCCRVRCYFCPPRSQGLEKGGYPRLTLENPNIPQDLPLFPLLLAPYRVLTPGVVLLTRRIRPFVLTHLPCSWA